VGSGVAANDAVVPRLSTVTKQETTKRMSRPFICVWLRQTRYCKI
jgi:hypothetical protein